MANEGNANINLNIRAQVTGNANSSFDDLDKRSSALKDKMNAAGDAANAAAGKFAGAGKKIGEEFFEFNNRKINKFVDMFLGGGAFGLAMKAGELAVGALAGVIKDQFVKWTETAEDRVASLMAEIQKADKALSGMGANEFYGQAQLATRQAQQALDEKQAQLDSVRSAADMRAIDRAQKIAELNQEMVLLKDQLARKEVEERQALEMSMALEEASTELWDKKTGKVEDHTKAIDKLREAEQERWNIVFAGEQDLNEWHAKNGQATLDRIMGIEAETEAIMASKEAQVAADWESRTAMADAQEEFHRLETERQIAHEKSLAQITSQMRGGVLNSFIGAWTSAFEQLGATGRISFKDLASGFLASLGQVAMQMGQMLILAGTGWGLIPGFQASFGAVASGVALTALGAAMKGIASRGGGQASESLGGYGRGSGQYGFSAQPYAASAGGGYGGNTTNNNSNYTFNLNGTFMGTPQEMAQYLDDTFNKARRQGYT